MAARFTREELAGQRGQTVPDLIGAGCRLLFVGINPGLWTAATQTHFCHPSNRFYPALRQAGLIDWEIDTSGGLDDAQKADLIEKGIGITNLVEYATARASELPSDDLRRGASRLEVRVQNVKPRVVAVAGVTAFRTAFSRHGALLGRQPGQLGSAELWVLPNPSGLNAHETVESLAGWYRAAADAAGV